MDRIKDEDRRQRDFDDLQNELAGRDVGRVQRFLNDGPLSDEARRKKRAREAAHNRLMELLSDPAYRAKYEAVGTRLREAEEATERILQKLQDKITDIRGEMDDMRGRAARLPDGTPVFRDKDGNIRREDGSLVDDDLAATIVWRGDEPGFEAMQSKKQSLADLQDQHNEAVTYQTDVLGRARDRLSDADNPPSLEELDDIMGDIETGIPMTVRDQVAFSAPDDVPNQEAGPVAIPDLGSKP